MSGPADEKRASKLTRLRSSHYEESCCNEVGNVGLEGKRR